MKKVLSAFLTIAAVAALLLSPLMKTSADAANAYDAAKAIAYAKDPDNVYNTTGLCATFVSRCLQAGNLTDVSYSTPGNLVAHLENKGYGVKYNLNDTNLTKLKAGDVIAWFCSNHGSSGYYGLHIIFVTEVDQSAKTLRYSARNNNHCNELMTFSQLKNWSVKCDSCGTASHAYPVFVSMNAAAGTYKLYTFLNYSGKNYLPGSDFSSLNTEFWYSRDTSVATLSIDSQTRHNGYNSLKIVNATAGSSGKDLGIATYTMSRTDSGAVGDSKNMTLSFWAKASNSGAKMYFRWGYESDFRSVTLSDSWQKYTVRMDKTTSVNHWMHPYVNKAGTVWITEMQLEDGTTATDFVPEPKGIYQVVNESEGGEYVLPNPPTREGYDFAGWYTAAGGGSQITTSTTVKNGNFNVFAHWTPATYTVYFDPNGGSCSTGSKTVTYGSTYGNLPTPIRTGYTFDGWYTSSSGGTRIYSSTTVTSAYSHYLYAHWTADGPTITSQPQNTSAFVNATASFNVSAAGTGLSYQWQYKYPDGNWTNSGYTSAKTANLSFAAPAKYNKMQYRCIITDANGNSVTSAAVTLTIKSRITVQPAHTNAAVGETARFNIKATGAGLAYQWQYKYPDGSWTNSGYSSAKTATLKFAALAKYNKLQYRCLVTDENGEKLTSSAVLLTIAPKITAQPQNTTAEVGETARFAVTATGAGLSYQWQYKYPDGEWLNSFVPTANDPEVLLAAKAKHNGIRYRCIITDENGEKLTSAIATLKIMPKITSQPQSTNAAVGDTARFTVTATGAGLSYQWQYQYPDEEWQNSFVPTANDPEVLLAAKAKHNGIRYRCIITDENGEKLTSSAATLTITAKITSQPKSITASAGTTAIFTVAATGAGLRYQWQYKYPDGSWTNSGYSSAKTAVLSVPVLEKYNGIQYRCRITDENGRTLMTSAVTLTVLGN